MKNWWILLVQSFTALMPLLMASSAFGLGRRHWSSQQCYLHSLHTLSVVLFNGHKMAVVVVVDSNDFDVNQHYSSVFFICFSHISVVLTEMRVLSSYRNYGNV